VRRESEVPSSDPQPRPPRLPHFAPFTNNAMEMGWRCRKDIRKTVTSICNLIIDHETRHWHLVNSPSCVSATVTTVAGRGAYFAKPSLSFESQPRLSYYGKRRQSYLGDFSFDVTPTLEPPQVDHTPRINDNCFTVSHNNPLLDV